MARTYASEVEAFGQFSLLSVRGEADLATAPRLQGDLERATAAASGDLVLDLSGLEFMDSTALLVLLAAQDALAQEGRALVVVAARQVRRLFRLTGVDTAFRMEDSVETAMRRIVAAHLPGTQRLAHEHVREAVPW